MRPRIAGALLLGGMHLLVVGTTLIGSGGAGEGQAFLVALVDFPLVLLLRALPGGSHVLYGSTALYVLVFSAAGTVMYGVTGWFLAVLFTRRPVA